MSLVDKLAWQGYTRLTQEDMATPHCFQVKTSFTVSHP